MEYNNCEVKLYFTCMEEYEVGKVDVMENGTHKNEVVYFTAVYE